MYFLRIIFAILLVAISAPAHAMKPCPTNTWYDNQNMPDAQWEQQAKRIVVAEVISRVENIHPYENCTLDDKTQCEMVDQSTLTVKIIRVEKGNAQPNQVVTLQKNFCGEDFPKTDGGTYRFFFNDDVDSSWFYDHYTRLP